MNDLTFAWNRSQNQRHHGQYWQEFLSGIGLFLAALLLFGLNLDSPLLNGQETIIATMAKEMSEQSFNFGRWLFPTVWGDSFYPYPPLGIGLTTIAYWWGGMDEQTTRLPGAILTALCIPLFYFLGREIFARWMPALFSALILLTLFPVVIQGRLALLDGIMLCFQLLTMFCLLRSRRDLRWSLGVGLSLSCLFLTHGIIGLFLSFVVLIFIVWDTPRLLTSAYFGLGMVLGLLPGIGWYTQQGMLYGQSFFRAMFITPLAENHGLFRGLLGIHAVELLKSSLPWLIFAVYGGFLATKYLVWGWSKLILVWGGVYLIVFSLLPLPTVSYLMPFYPPLALAGGMALAEVYHWPINRPYPKLWWIILLGMSGVISLVSLSFLLNFPWDFSYLSYRFLLIVTLGSIAFTFLTTAVLIAQRDSQFIVILVWGMYISLLLWVNSPYWTGEIKANSSIINTIALNEFSGIS
ncbi:glycosyl transferase family 39 [Rippkaea orientalis PCC 8801]|uniref:Glycosyl transferase family 39 n=1 Tax=Rippkaea orientalis (strain PCC 8801 / RF-1) TaxID=41431 RepID=B7JYA1_RIPO1|nr:phospholipid carrier-dependent glycosyltransferase [Rippkaea orientalis]ACK67203.1 glycosyl transferase family 39 [Rippkaea orientalis PCC 8801]